MADPPTIMYTISQLNSHSARTNVSTYARLKVAGFFSNHSRVLKVTYTLKILHNALQCLLLPSISSLSPTVYFVSQTISSLYNASWFGSNTTGVSLCQYERKKKSNIPNVSGLWIITPAHSRGKHGMINYGTQFFFGTFFVCITAVLTPTETSCNLKEALKSTLTKWSK